MPLPEIQDQIHAFFKPNDFFQNCQTSLFYKKPRHQKTTQEDYSLPKNLHNQSLTAIRYHVRQGPAVIQSAYQQL